MGYIKLVPSKTGLIYRIMEESYPLLHTLYKKCEQAETSEKFTRFTDERTGKDNYCQIIIEEVRGVIKKNDTDIELAVKHFLDTIKEMFMGNEQEGKVNTENGNALTAGLYTQDLKEIEKNCIFYSCSQDLTGPRKLRVEYDEVKDIYIFLSDVGVCFKKGK